MRLVWFCCAVVIGALVAAGCGSDATDSEREARAERITKQYLRAAAAGRSDRLCALRTGRAVGRLGGPGQCERELDALRPDAGPKLEALNARSARVLSRETTTSGDTARVVVDIGRADVESGRAVAGEILEVDLRLEKDRYRIDQIGLAVFVD
jgi:hypothetical protein